MSTSSPSRLLSKSPTLGPTLGPPSGPSSDPPHWVPLRESLVFSVLAPSSRPTETPTRHGHEPSSSPALRASSGTAPRPAAAHNPDHWTSPYIVSSLMSMSLSTPPTARRLPLNELSLLNAPYRSPDEGNIVAPAAAYVAVGAIVIGIAALALHARRGKKKRREWLAKWGGSDDFELSERRMDDTDDGLEKWAMKRANGKAREVSADREGELHLSWVFTTADPTVPRTITISKDPVGNGNRCMEVVAPAGNVGLVLVNPNTPGPASVAKVLEDGLMAGKICQGDRIVAVDGEDVRRMPALEVSRLLTSRRRNLERRICILRAAGDEGRRQRQQQSHGTGRKGAKPKHPKPAIDRATTLNEDAICDEDRRLFIAPAGETGLVLACPDKPGPAYVVLVRNDGLMAGKILAGDRIVAVDDEDVRGMPSAEVSELLESRSWNPSRSIQVVRTAAAGCKGHDEESGSAALGRRPSPPSPEDPVGDAVRRRTFDAPAGEAGISYHRRTFVAPAGEVGISFVSPDEPGPARVVQTRKEGPLEGKIRPGDEIVAVDGTDVRGMTATELSKLLESRRENPAMSISVLRTAGGQGMPSAEVSKLQKSRSWNLSRSIQVARTAAADGKGRDEVSGTAALGRRPSPPSPEDPIGNAVRRRTFDAPAGEAGISYRQRTFVAPAGEAGISFVSPDEPGPARVVQTRKEGPLAGKIRPGDEIVAVDGTDVQGMTATELSKLLESRRENPAMSISVLRTAGGSGGRSSYPPSMEPLIEDPVDGADQLLDVVTPAGMAGILLFDPDPHGPTCVLRGQDEGPLEGRIRKGNRIITVDGKDVRKLKATEVSKLLASRHGNRKRRIGVLRPDSGAGKEDHAGAAEKSSQTKIDIVAPSGDLGVTLGGPIDVRETYVIGITEISPIKSTILLGDKVYNNIKLGDRVVAIDGKDVSKWLAADVSRVLASKCKNSRRTITVSREGTYQDEPTPLRLV